MELPVEGQPHSVVFLPVTGRRTPEPRTASQGGSNPVGLYRRLEDLYLEKEDQAEVWVKISTDDVAGAVLRIRTSTTRSTCARPTGSLWGKPPRPSCFALSFTSHPHKWQALANSRPSRPTGLHSQRPTTRPCRRGHGQSGRLLLRLSGRRGQHLHGDL